MSASKLKFAIVGLDHWYTSNELAEQLHQHPETELVGIADAQPGRAEEVAAGIGLANYSTDLQEYISHPEVDVICSFVSVEQNAEIVIAAAKAGKHILSVKPFAMNLEEGSAIVDAVREAGVVFVPAETRLRDSALHRHIKGMITSGEIGDVVSGHFTLTSSPPQNWPGAAYDGGWFADPDRTVGGAWIDHAIYKVDRLRWFLGEKIVRVGGRTANLVHQDMQVEDFGHAIVEFESGATFAIEDTWSAPAGSWRNTAEIVGTKAVLSLDSTSSEMTTYGLGENPGWQVQSVPADGFDPIAPLVSAFFGGDRGNLGDEVDAWENLAACIAFYEAADSGCFVDVPHLDR